MYFSRTKYFNDHSKYSLKWFGWKIIKTIFTPPPLLLQHHYVLRGGGCWSKFRGIFFLMNFELLTFPCREMIKLSIHIWHDSKMNPFLYRKRIFWCDACIVYIDITKLKNAFSPLCIFELKVVFRYHFLSHFLAELNEICCGSLLNSILNTYRRKFL